MVEVSENFVPVLAALAKLVVLAMLLERGLILIFEYRWYEKFFSGKGLKVPISFGGAWLICWYYDFDVVAALLEPTAITPLGIFVTAAVTAGGSAAAITLFQGALGFSKGAQDQLRELRQKQREADLAEAEARKKNATGP
jgi:hypothetical protein